LCNSAFTDPRQRQLFKNICYVGALTHLIDLDIEIVEQLLSEEFKGKERLIRPNQQALHLGRDYAEAHLEQIAVAPHQGQRGGDRIFVEGNAAAALGALYGGATVCGLVSDHASTSVAEASKAIASASARSRQRQGALRHRAGGRRDRPRSAW